jgi:hypothetical protein
MFHRFQSAVPNGRGRFPGVFAMTNGLLRAGLLSDADEEWVREENARGELAYTDPSSVVLDCYSPTTNSGARSWFRSEARELLAMTSGYTALLDRYGISWVELRTERPGRIVYEDEVQVVAVPFTHEEHWPLPALGVRTAEVSRADRSRAR